MGTVFVMIFSPSLTDTLIIQNSVKFTNGPCMEEIRMCGQYISNGKGIFPLLNRSFIRKDDTQQNGLVPVLAKPVLPSRIPPLHVHIAF